jgi:hypothetical protein
MKYLKIILLQLVLLSSTSLSQEYGIKIGVTNSNILITDKVYTSLGGVSPYYSQGYSLNPSICIFANVVSSQIIDLQTNLSYVSIGSSQTNEYPYMEIDNNGNNVEKFEKYTSDIVLRCIQFSIDAQPKLILRKTIFYATIGPSIIYLLKASNISMKGDNKSFMFGASIGGGIDFNSLLGINVFLEAKYYHDFAPFYETPYAHLWNQYFAFSIGTKF